MENEKSEIMKIKQKIIDQEKTIKKYEQLMDSIASMVGLDATVNYWDIVKKASELGLCLSRPIEVEIYKTNIDHEYLHDKIKDIEKRIEKLEKLEKL